MFDAANRGFGGVRPLRPLLIPPSPKGDTQRQISGRACPATSSSRGSTGTPKHADGHRHSTLARGGLGSGGAQAQPSATGRALQPAMWAIDRAITAAAR